MHCERKHFLHAFLELFYNTSWEPLETVANRVRSSNLLSHSNSPDEAGGDILRIEIILSLLFPFLTELITSRGIVTEHITFKEQGLNTNDIIN